MKHPLWQWILMLGVLAALFLAVRSGFDKNVPMSRTSRCIRVVGGSIWAGIILLGMILELWQSLSKK
jgi:hypothetical protein